MAFRYFREMFGIRPDDYMVRLVPSIYESARFTSVEVASKWEGTVSSEIEQMKREK